MFTSFICYLLPPLEPGSSNKFCKNLKTQPGQGTGEQASCVSKVQVAAFGCGFVVVGLFLFPKLEEVPSRWNTSC